MLSRRDLIGWIAVMLLLGVASCAAQSATRAAEVDEATARYYAQTAEYLDPRLFAANADTYRFTNIFVHAKILKLEQATYGGTSIYAAAEVRDSDVIEPLIIHLSDEFMPFADSPLLVDECYRFYGFVGIYMTVTEPTSGAEHTLPSLEGYLFELVAHDGFGGCAAP